MLYAMDHPLHSFEASSSDFKVVAAYNADKKELSLVAAMVAVKSFDSGNSNRDSHVIEATEALKYPNVTFTSEKLTYAGEKVTASGKLVFHGVTQPFEITGTQKIAGNKLVLTGKMNVDMTEFGIEPPSIMGLATDKIIKLDYTFTFPL